MKQARQRFYIFLGGVFLSTLSLGACQASTSSPPLPEEDSFHVALIVDGSLNDGSFNEGAWVGIQKAKEDLGYKVFFSVNKQASEYPGSFARLEEQNPALFLSIGYKLEDEVRRQARENPFFRYASIDVTKEDIISENLTTISFSVEQAAFLAGYLAGRLTQTGKVGFLGGMEGDIVGAFDYGFEAGALHANPKVTVIKQYAQNFFDTAKGRSIGDLMIQNGVDILAHAAGPTGNGMIEVVKERQAEREREGNPHHLWAIGVDIDQSFLAPEVVLTSMIKRVDKVVYVLLENLKKDEFSGGRHILYGLEGDFVGLVEIDPFRVSQGILDEIEIVKGNIQSGVIKVPYNAEGNYR